ncbi:MAG: hypothetical protein HRF51_13040 [bacterium]|jgi:hypothetical protein
MTPPRLDRELLQKIAAKRKNKPGPVTDKERQAVNVKVSKTASRLGISSEAALVLLAKQLDIGTSSYLRTLDSNKQAEVRDALPNIFPEGKLVRNRRTAGTPSNGRVSRASERTARRAAIDYLIEDTELKDRSKDILLARSKFDRPINQATLILEDRIRKKSQPSRALVGENLVNYAVNSDLSRTVLKVSDNSDEQKGYADIIRGVMLAFRNMTHHHVIDSFTREDSLRICGFIDVLLRVVNSAVKIR